MERQLLISYDLKKPGKDYSNLITTIRLIGKASTIHLLESVWLITTTSSIRDVMTRLRIVTDSNDSIVIVEVSDIGWHNVEPLMPLRLQTRFRR